MKQENRHACSIKDTLESSLPPLKNNKFHATLKRFARQITLVNRKHPKCFYYFISNSAFLYEKQRHLRSKYPFVIHPLSLFRIYWEIWMLFIFTAAIMVFPLNVAFHKHSSHIDLTILIVLIDIACIVDIILNFITGYCKKDTKEIILNFNEISMHYLSGFFLFDLPSSLPLFVFKAQAENRVDDFIYDIMILLKLFRLITLFEYMKNLFDLWKVSMNIFRGIKYSILTLIILHWLACVFYIVPLEVKKYRGYWDSNSWVVKAGLTNKDTTITKIYLLSMFQAGCHIVGFEGDIYPPLTNEDIILNSIALLFGLILYYWVFVVFLQIMLCHAARYSKYQEIEIQLQEYMKHKQLPLVMQNRLLAYYQYRFQNAYFREGAITSILSDRLKWEINTYCCKRIIENVSVFKELSADVLDDIIASLKMEIFLPGDVLVKAGSVGDCMYFLASGTVTVLTSTGKEVCHLQDGAYFGEIALLMKDKKRIATVIAIEICEVYRLNRKNFKHCFHHNIDLYKKLEIIAQKRLKKTIITENIHKEYFRSRTVADDSDFFFF